MRWHASTSRWYNDTDTEAIENATLFASLLMLDYGWTFEACCGVMGNISNEGMWNPWSWQANVSGGPLANALTKAGARSDTTRIHGYGLIGWTPAKKYQFSDGGYFNYGQENYWGYGPLWSDEAGRETDGYAQTKLIGEAFARSDGNIWIQRKPCTQSQFKVLTDVEDAAYYWLWNAEYPAHITQAEPVRKADAVAWYNRLGGPNFQPVNPKGEDGGIINLLVLLKRGVDNTYGY